ncbi:MAG: metal-dependent hydrolase [Desulfobacterales bacterium]|jgi:inner membrane protein
MPTIFTHPAIPLAIGLGLGKDVVPTPLLIAGVAVSVMPDLDVLAFRYGISYASNFGHRGFSHSFLFAAVLALLGACAFRYFQASFGRVFVFLFLAAVSHGILDAFTNGGLGIAFLWPFTPERYFAPVQVIQVAPIGVSRFLSPRGVSVLISEIIWVWVPCIIIGIGLYVMKGTIAVTFGCPGHGNRYNG